MQSVAKNVETHEKRLCRESADYLREGFPAPAAAQTPLGYVDGMNAILGGSLHIFFFCIFFPLYIDCDAMHDLSLSVSLSLFLRALSLIAHTNSGLPQKTSERLLQHTTTA